MGTTPKNNAKLSSRRKKKLGFDEWKIQHHPLAQLGINRNPHFKPIQGLFFSMDCRTTDGYGFLHGRPVVSEGILPDFSVDHGRMKPVKDAQGQRDALDDGPRQEAVKVELDGIGFDFLHFKSVDQPQGHVGDE